MAYNDYYNTNPSGAGGGYISMLEGYAKNYMDPNSQYNKGQYNQFKQMGTDNAAMQGQQGMRMQAAGQNPFANEQYRASMSDATGQAHNAYMQQNQQSQQLGTGMLGMSMQARMQMAQQEQQQQQWEAEQKQQKLGQWMGLGGTLLGAAAMGPMGGMFGKWAGKGIGNVFNSIFGKKDTTGVQNDWYYNRFE